jgi:hypothetical protein
MPNVNFYDNGVVAGAAGTISKTCHHAGQFLFRSRLHRGQHGQRRHLFRHHLRAANNVAITTFGTTQIRVAPVSQTIASGSFRGLERLCRGPLPHTWQWYGGPSPNTNPPIAGATTPNYNTGPSSTTPATGCAWSGRRLRLRDQQHREPSRSRAIQRQLFRSRSRPAAALLQNGNLFTVQRFQIQQQGNYVFTATPGFTLATYQNYFDPLQTALELSGAC